MFDRWIVLNMLLQVAFDVAVYWFLGPKALAYMGLSFFFFSGSTPARCPVDSGALPWWLPAGDVQLLRSFEYGGRLNVGYHNEHHDLPSVPWNLLPKIKRAAPEMYDTLISHRSWTKLLFHLPVRPEHEFVLAPGAKRARPLYGRE